MANPIFLPKRSNTASSVPTTGNLVDGELAINSADKKIYLRVGTNIIEVANAGGGAGNSIGQGNSSVTVTDTGANGTVSLIADGTTIQTVTATGTVHVGSFSNTGSILARAAAGQDGVHLIGRAGGSGNFEVNITPTTLTADRTLTLADGDTTLQPGTMATTSGTLAQFSSTTSLQLSNIISDETGTGSLVFANTPTLVTPNIGDATGTSLVLNGDARITGANKARFGGTSSTSNFYIHYNSTTNSLDFVAG